MTSILEFNHISKTYQKDKQQVRALDDVCFDVFEGEVFGFVGPNGAGKSTTIKVMLDIIRDYEGSVRIFGVDARQAQSRQHVAFVPESPALYEQFTPMEILRMSLRMYGVAAGHEEEWCHTWLEKFSLTPFVNRKVRELSKGNAQRLALARAMAVRPKLLILDEPLSGLDPVGRKDVVNILEDYKKEGGAIFFTSHVLHDVERIADRFGFINNGKLLVTQSPQEVLSGQAGMFRIRYHDASGKIQEGEALRAQEFELEISQQDMPMWLAKLNEAGGKIIHIQPAVSLERVFFNILEQSNNSIASNAEGLA